MENLAFGSPNILRWRLQDPSKIPVIDLSPPRQPIEHHQHLPIVPFSLNTPSSDEGFLCQNVVSGSTKIEPIILSHRWRVENFETLMKLTKPGQCLRSQVLKHVKLPSVCWQLCLYPGGKRNENEGFVSLFLKMSAAHPEAVVDLKAEYSFHFLDDRNIPQFSNTYLGEFKSSPDSCHFWGLRNIPRNRIRCCLLVDGSLLILCEVIVLPDMKTQDDRAKAVYPSQLSKVSQTFLSNQEKMFTNGAFADYTVVVPNSSENPGREFKVHRSVLAAHSDVFQAMLLHEDLQEALDSRLVISDYNVQSVHSFLKYLYTGRVTEAELEQCAAELLELCGWLFNGYLDILNQCFILPHPVDQMSKFSELSDKYGVGVLKAVSEGYLVSSIDICNVCQLIALAYLHGADILKSACESLIRDHRQYIFSSRSWTELKTRNAELTIKILERLIYPESACGPSSPKRLKS